MEEAITTTFDEQMLDRYDEVINITMVNLYTLTKDAGKICLTGLDKNNQDHLLMLRVALLAKDIYGFPLTMDVSFWDSLVLNWKMRKISRRVPREKNPKSYVHVQDLIEFMYPPIREHLGLSFRFADIYNAFYRKELG